MRSCRRKRWLRLNCECRLLRRVLIYSCQGQRCFSFDILCQQEYSHSYWMTQSQKASSPLFEFSSYFLLLWGLYTSLLIHGSFRHNNKVISQFFKNGILHFCFQDTNVIISLCIFQKPLMYICCFHKIFFINHQ